MSPKTTLLTRFWRQVPFFLWLPKGLAKGDNLFQHRFPKPTPHRQCSEKALDVGLQSRWLEPIIRVENKDFGSNGPGRIQLGKKIRDVGNNHQKPMILGGVCRNN